MAEIKITTGEPTMCLIDTVGLMKRGEPVDIPQRQLFDWLDQLVLLLYKEGYAENQVKRMKEAESLIGLALDFWSAPGIDMPSVDTFDDMAKFMGKRWKCRWDDDGNYLGEPIKPVGMSAEEHDAREKFCLEEG